MRPAGLYSWRDGVAREEDESTGYVLSRANLVKLAQALPTTIAQVGSGSCRFTHRLIDAYYCITLCRR